MKRQVAYKVWIGNLLGKKLVKALGEWEPNYVEVKEWKVSRVNVVATIVDKFLGEDGSYGTLMIDDGSGNLRVRGWQEEAKLFEGVNVGDVVLIVGRVKDYTGEIYLSPEIIKKLDTDWLKLRQKELEKLHGKFESRVEVTKDNFVDLRGKILEVLKEKDEGLGVDVAFIFDKVGHCEEVVKDMVSNGELFYVKPGFLKVMV